MIDLLFPLHTENTDILSSDSNHDALLSTLLETSFVTHELRLTTIPVALAYVCLSLVLLHSVLLRNRFLWNVRYDSGNVLRSSLTVVPDVFPHHV